MHNEIFRGWFPQVIALLFNTVALYKRNCNLQHKYLHLHGEQRASLLSSPPGKSVSFALYLLCSTWMRIFILLLGNKADDGWQGTTSRRRKKSTTIQ